MPPDYVKAAKAAELSDGTMKKVVVNGQDILLANISGQFYAISNKCPHLGGDLSTGKLEGKVVTCPRHGSQFDVTNGQVIRWTRFGGAVKTVVGVVKPARPPKTYRTKVEYGEIYIEA